VALTDALNDPEVQLEEGAETLGPMLMHLATGIGFLRVIDDLMHVALQRSIAAGGVGVELTPSLDGESLIHFAQKCRRGAPQVGSTNTDKKKPVVRQWRVHLARGGDFW
jgi:hypothetical protein